MIVKNESRIIRRLLESVAPIIDSYCICDTGSTDDTIAIIEEFFTSKGIPGKIPREPFRDFAHNRSFALKQCESMPVDYILLLDADMIFQLGTGITPEDFKRGLTHDAYHMFQGTDTFYYKNARIVKNTIGASYWGVTHEYLKTPEGTTYGLLEKPRAFINDVGDGGSKADKFERDIRLLLKGLEDNPNNDRYTFYLANSYRDHGDNDLAIEYYKKRIEIGGWQEEAWHSYYSIGKCYKAKGDMLNAVHWWMEAYQFFPKRIENLYEIISHYRQIGKNQIAYMFYIMALKQVLLNPTPDYLFLQRDVYDYKLDYEFSIIGYYCNVDNYDMTRICTKVLNCKNTEWNIVRNVMSNYKFYSKKLVDFKTTFPEHLKTKLLNVGKELVSKESDGAFFVASTPSLAIVGNELVVNVRYVNYRINDRGGYENQEHIATKNVIARFDLATFEQIGEDEFMWYDSSIDNLYVGLEDVRIFLSESQNRLLYNANRGLGSHNLKVEHGQVFTREERSGQVFTRKERSGQVFTREERSGQVFTRNEVLTKETNASGLITMEGQKEVEKNWVMFEDAAGNLKIVYNWHDLVIGDCLLNENPENDGEKWTFKKTHAIKTPPIFKYFRGSTNGILIGNEIWFFCHVVSYEDRRYYYHSIFTLDATTYEVKRFTPLFTFEGDKVEYTLGFVYQEDATELKTQPNQSGGTSFAVSDDEPSDGTFWIGYSKMDCSTHYMAIKKSAIEGLMTV
jgi:tetratricopeptide (TPR) repeat protein